MKEMNKMLIETKRSKGWGVLVIREVLSEEVTQAEI